MGYTTYSAEIYPGLNFYLYLDFMLEQNLLGQKNNSI